MEGGRPANVQIAWREGNSRASGRQRHYRQLPLGQLSPTRWRPEMGRKWTGTWKIQNNKLCMSNPNLDSPDCNEVWMSGANIRMRANKEQETFDAVVEKHKAR